MILLSSVHFYIINVFPLKSTKQDHIVFNVELRKHVGIYF